MKESASVETTPSSKKRKNPIDPKAPKRRMKTRFI